MNIKDSSLLVCLGGALVLLGFGIYYMLNLYGYALMDDSKECIDDNLCIVKKYQPSGVAVIAENNTLVPVTVSREIDGKVECYQGEAIKKISVEPNASEKLAEINGCSFFEIPARFLDVKYTILRIGDTHDDSYLYKIPFCEGCSYDILQGYDAPFTHFGKHRYAIDFASPVGVNVHASRKGKVVGMESDYQEGGEDIELYDKGNYIWILHEDGSLANYYHLDKEGFSVKVGDYVEKGQLLARSGNTGFTSGPHLHFEVYVANSIKGPKTIPVKFYLSKDQIRPEVIGLGESPEFFRKE